MKVRVEFFGISRARAGVACASVEFFDNGPTLADLLEELARQFPSFGETCVTNRQLARGYVANLEGRQFLASPDHPLCEGNTVLIMSADAGG